MDGRIDPVRTGLLYQLGLLLSAVVMLVLPLVYLSLIVGVGYLIYLHAVNDTAVLDHTSPRAALVVYLGPIIAGLIVIAFMVKPLLARAVDDSVPLTLRREDEPVLFEFVDRLCRAVGSPTPCRIDVDLDVNASASFKGGWTGLFGRSLVLTFGLPLAAGLDVRQFSGVLAHELGHFAQGSGMRLSFIVRRMNGWFYRVVYQRDQWDAAMIAGARSNQGAVTLICWVTLAVVWVTRRVLWILMMLAHGITAFLMRQMEFDADRHLCRVVGSETFDPTFQNIRCLGLATKVAFNDLDAAWREKRLCDDLPALIHSRHNDMPAEAQTALLEAARGEKTGWFDVHPSDAARSASARKEGAPGLFRVNAPATILFKNFPELSRIATMLFYKRSMGAAFKPHLLAKTESLVAERVEVEQTFDALKAYCMGLVDGLRPVFPDRLIERPRSDVAAAERLLALRTKLADMEPGARSAAERFSKAFDRGALLGVVKELRTAGIRKSGAKDESVDKLSDEALAAEESGCNKECARALAVMEQAQAVAMERMSLALAMAEPKQAAPVVEADDGDDYELADEAKAGSEDLLYSALTAMRPAAEDVKALRGHVMSLAVLVGRIRGSTDSKPLVDTILWHSRKASGLLNEMHQQLGHVRYPYSDENKKLTLAAYVVRAIPAYNHVGKVGQAAQGAIDAYSSLYVRLMSDLANRAQKVETELGLPPLEMSPAVTSSK
jgi:Zn-dependent protease with chaperone function